MKTPDPTPQDHSPELPTHSFRECGLDDPRPIVAWLPSPEQIERWKTQIRLERWERLARGEEDDVTI